MTQEEFSLTAAAMKAVFTDPKFLPDKHAIGVWYGFLKDLTNAQCQAAVSEYISTHKFPPTIAEIRELAFKRTQPVAESSVSSLEAWARVRKAVRNGTYGAEQEFERLPEAIQAALGTPANIREMAAMDSEKLETVEKGRFIRAYESAVAQIHEDAQIPPAIKALIERVELQALEVKD